MKKLLTLFLMLLAVLTLCLTSLAESDPQSDRIQQRAEPTGEPAAEEAAPSPTPVTYRGYVYVQYNGRFAWYGLAQTAEESYPITIRQMTATGEECVNTLMITDQGVYMESANCSNQDCVGMGEINLENMELTFGMIVCLPHEVYIQLYTPEDFQDWYRNYMQTINQ